MQRRVYIETYGCQMNEHDSERMLRLLEGFHYTETKEANQADLILINTCSVREKPEHKVYSALGRFRKLKERKGTVIGVAGCVAQQEGERLLDRVPYLDLVIGTHAIPMLAHLLERIEVSGQRVCETRFDRSGEYLKTSLPEKPLAKVKSYVTIMQGCDHFCSFCIVPYVRGREMSRPSGEILEEIRHLATIRGTVVQPPPVDPDKPPPVDPPTTPQKISRITYVYEKDTANCPRPVALALQKLNGMSIVATEFEEDTTDSSGSVPAQYTIPLNAARQVGLPALVVQSQLRWCVWSSTR